VFGVNGGELLVLILIAVIVIGPERMPAYAKQFKDFVVGARDYARATKESVTAEIGDEVDWKQLDPRQYDPRRIVREALSEPSPSGASRAAASAKPAPAADAAGSLAAGEAPPFDADAT
jgi:sec-independent protein translocase protein TatB